MGGDHAGQVRRHAGAADEGHVARLAGRADQRHHLGRIAVRGQHPHIRLDAERLEGLGRGGASCPRRWPIPSGLQPSPARSLVGAAAMSLRTCMPGQLRQATAWYARLRARADVGPERGDVEHAAPGGHQPALAVARPRRRRTPRRPRSATPWSRPSIAIADPRRLGVALGRAHHRHGRVVDEPGLVRRCGRPRPRLSSCTRSVRIRGSTTWDSGSPKRTLYSITLGPSGGEHEPGVEHAAVVDARAPAARPGWGRRPAP